MNAIFDLIKSHNSLIFLYEKLTILSSVVQYINYFIFSNNPPEYMKRQFIRNLIQNIDFKNAIESGTYFGRTTKLLSKNVSNVYSIEIASYLYKYVLRKRLRAQLFLGDSSEIITGILPMIEGRTLFFLDGHMSGGLTAKGNFVTPLKYELDILSTYKDLIESVILIDDAVSLNGINDYPSIDFIIDFALQRKLICFRTKLNSILVCNNTNAKKIKELYREIEIIN